MTPYEQLSADHNREKSIITKLMHSVPTTAVCKQKLSDLISEHELEEKVEALGGLDKLPLSFRLVFVDGGMRKIHSNSMDGTNIKTLRTNLKQIIRNITTSNFHKTRDNYYTNLYNIQVLIHGDSDIDFDFMTFDKQRIDKTTFPFRRINFVVWTTPFEEVRNMYKFNSI